MWRAVGGCRWLVVLDEWMSGWWVVGEGGSVLKVDGGKGRPGQAGRAVSTHLGEEVRITHNCLC